MDSAKLFRRFAVFGKFLDVFVVFGKLVNKFGRIRTHSEIFESFSMISNVFEHFWAFLVNCNG